MIVKLSGTKKSLRTRYSSVEHRVRIRTVKGRRVGGEAACTSSRKPQVRFPVHQAKLWVGELKGDGWVHED